MKSLFNILTIFTLSMVVGSCNKETTTIQKKPVNYTIILDLSDRILAPNQLDKDFHLITTFFEDFEKKARRNLIVTSNDCFTVKIIPQKNSPLDIDKYEDLLQIHLNELPASEKNKSLKKLSLTLKSTLAELKSKALYSKKSSDYFGVDIWSYFNNNGKDLSKKECENTILIITDGYFDFENQSHVIAKGNHFTSTKFLENLNQVSWKEEAVSKDFGLLPIKLNCKGNWIVAGFSSKKTNDILQVEKLIFFWDKWLKESGVSNTNLLLNSSKSNMNSSLKELL